MVDKLLWLVDHEAAAMCLPRDHMTKAISFHLIKDSMQLEGEGNGDTSAAAVGFIFFVILIRVVRVIVIIMNHKVTIVLLGGFARLLGLPPALGTWLL
jgi:hypothetical protein